MFAALRAGASGFLLKDVRPAELAEPSAWSPGATPCWRRPSPGGCSTASRAPCPDAERAAPRWRTCDELTDRELEVLRLVALALSNAEIAERLMLSEATVKTHVSSMLRKLGLRDRVQAVVCAYDVGLVRPRSS